MTTKIKNFEVTNYTTTKLKVKSTTEKVPEIINDVTTLSKQLTTITEDLKKLVEEDIESSDFIESTNNIITISNNMNAALAVTMKSLVNDAYERICKVSNDSKTFQRDLSEASSVVKKSLEELDGIGNKKIGRISNRTSTTGESSSKASTENNDGSKTQPLVETQKTETVAAKTAMAEPEAQEIKTLTQTPEPEQPAPAPTPSGGQVQGSLSPGTSATTFAAQSYHFSDEEYRVLCATVYAEAAEGNSYMTSDSMGVTSAILNRFETGNWGGSIVDVVSAKNQFSGYGYQNQKFASAMSDPNIIPPEMRSAIDRTLAGERNTAGTSFVGNGTHNTFR